MFDHTIAVLTLVVIGVPTLAIGYITLRRQINADKAAQRAREIQAALDHAELSRLREKYEGEGDR